MVLTVQDVIDGKAMSRFEAAKEIGMDPKTFTIHCRAGKISAKKFGNSILVHRDEVARYKSVWAKSRINTIDYWVYFLRCPDTLVAVYVGLTSNPKSRERAHLTTTNSCLKKSLWITELRSKGKKPILDVVLGPFSRSHGLAVETSLIEKHMRYGFNLNGDIRFKAIQPKGSSA